ncbi:hypothetical protein HZS_6196 [Henneguya salminicola]|nr:hypothetical protein HZS_6196 [Henneguya salminicola]
MKNIAFAQKVMRADYARLILADLIMMIFVLTVTPTKFAFQSPVILLICIQIKVTFLNVTIDSIKILYISDRTECNSVNSHQENKSQCVTLCKSSKFVLIDKV